MVNPLLYIEYSWIHHYCYSVLMASVLVCTRGYSPTYRVLNTQNLKWALLWRAFCIVNPTVIYRQKTIRIVHKRSNFTAGDFYVHSTQKVTEKVLTELTLRWRCFLVILAQWLLLCVWLLYVFLMYCSLQTHVNSLL